VTAPLAGAYAHARSNHPPPADRLGLRAVIECPWNRDRTPVESAIE
jgi:hypothetical protein